MQRSMILCARLAYMRPSVSWSRAWRQHLRVLVQSLTSLVLTHSSPVKAIGSKHFNQVTSETTETPYLSSCDGFGKQKFHQHALADAPLGQCRP